MGELERAGAAGGSRPAPCTPGRRPTRHRRRRHPDLARARRSPRTASAGTRASSTRAAATRRATALEACVASLEGARHGLAFASGLAAEDNVLRLLAPGDRVLLGNDAYGGTFRLIAKVHTARLPWTAVDLLDLDALAADWPADTSWCGWRRRPTRCCAASTSRRSPTIAHAHGALVVRRQHVRHAVPAAAARARRRHRRALGHEVPRRPQRRGRRVPRRSTTTTSPTACASPRTPPARCPSPFDCYLVLRGVKTLGVRMERHCANARAIVDLLVGHPAVERVLYPQLPDHPGHAAAAKQMRDFGGHGQLHAARRRARRRCAWRRRPSCSRSPSRSARSRA